MSRSSVSPAIQISHLLTTQGSDPAREETACQTRNIFLFGSELFNFSRLLTRLDFCLDPSLQALEVNEAQTS